MDLAMSGFLLCRWWWWWRRRRWNRIKTKKRSEWEKKTFRQIIMSAVTWSNATLSKLRQMYFHVVIFPVNTNTRSHFCPSLLIFAVLTYYLDKHTRIFETRDRNISSESNNQRNGTTATNEFVSHSVSEYIHTHLTILI